MASNDASQQKAFDELLNPFFAGLLSEDGSYKNTEHENAYDSSHSVLL